MNKISKEEFLASKANRLTMGALRKFVEKNPQILDSAPVVTERIEDKYFDKEDGWQVILEKGFHYWQTSDFNEKMLKEIEDRRKGQGEYDFKLNPEECLVELTDDLKEQFFSAWCISKNKDNSIVYIYNHY